MSQVERLVRRLDAEGEKGPRAAIRALARIGKPALKPLLEAAVSLRGRLRSWSLTALGEIGGPGARAAIRKGARDPHMSPWLHALMALERIRDPQSLRIAIRLLKDPSGGVRINAVDVLARLGDRKAVAALRRCLKDPKGYVRQHAAEAIQRLTSPAG